MRCFLGSQERLHHESSDADLVYYAHVSLCALRHYIIRSAEMLLSRSMFTEAVVERDWQKARVPWKRKL